MHLTGESGAKKDQITYIFVLIIARIKFNSVLSNERIAQFS